MQTTDGKERGTYDERGGDDARHPEPLRDDVKPEMVRGGRLVPHGHERGSDDGHQAGAEGQCVQSPGPAHDPNRRNVRYGLAYTAAAVRTVHSPSGKYAPGGDCYLRRAHEVKTALTDGDLSRYVQNEVIGEVLEEMSTDALRNLGGV